MNNFVLKIINSLIIVNEDWLWVERNEEIKVQLKIES